MTSGKYKVYKHTSPDGKVYIGITCQTVEKRWENGNGYKKNKYFYAAIQKHGWENFQHEILYKGISKEEAEQKEIELIAQYKSNKREFGYNLSTGGESAAAGVKRSPETRAKMSKAKKGTKQTPEAIQKRVEATLARRRNGGKSYALEEILNRLEDIEKWARDGATEQQIARYFGITRQTFYKYKNDNIVIFDAIKKGRMSLVEDLKGALVKKAKGFQYVEKKIIKEHGAVVREEIYEKASLPDVAALNLLLKNYDADNWANDPQALKMRQKEIELQERRIEQNEW